MKALTMFRRAPRLTRRPQAIVLPADDTTLANWNYEIFSNWDFNSTTKATFVTGQLFPAVPGIVDTAKRAAAKGYCGLRHHGPASQAPATLGNLTPDGVGVDAGSRRRQR